MRTLVFLAVVNVIANFPGMGQRVVTRSTVSVRILDKETFKPVSATMIIVGQKPGKQITPSLEDGVYNFKVPGNDTSVISIFADGYELLSESISAGKMRSKEVFYLTPKPSLNRVDRETKNTSALSRPLLNEIIISTVYFAQSKAHISSGSETKLDEMIQYMLDDLSSKIELFGHTDNQGDPDKNLILSNDRVKAVETYLCEHGISPSRITGEGFGSIAPIAPNDTEENRSRNRRVEMKLKGL